MSELKHYKLDGAIHSQFGDFVHRHPADVEDVDSAANLYNEGGGENQVHGPHDFVGIGLHAIQQTGGVLTHKGREIEAMHMEQTSGKPISDQSVLKYGGKNTKFSDILARSSDSGLKKNQSFSDLKKSDGKLRDLTDQEWAHLKSLQYPGKREHVKVHPETQEIHEYGKPVQWRMPKSEDLKKMTPDEKRTQSTTPSIVPQYSKDGVPAPEPKGLKRGQSFRDMKKGEMPLEERWGLVPGMRVSHPKHGIGVVRKVHADRHATVEFEQPNKKAAARPNKAIQVPASELTKKPFTRHGG